ncbi:MAG TPA: hypothetical protein VGG39_27210 [Polyangiaceae bacterium]
MRSPLLLILGMMALAAACGGKTNGGGPGGGGSSSGSSSSGSSSGSGSGSSSGISSSSGSGSGGSSSGISSSSGGSSSGGNYCEPLPGCTSSTECPDPGGCGDCYCSGGGWACTGCGDDATDAYPPPDDAPYGYCPGAPPASGSICYEDGTTCGYGSNGDGCGEECTCANGTWQCYSDPCPPPECPPYVPTPGTYCAGGGESCFYGSGSCDSTDCYCDANSGTWSCSYSACVDSGPPFDGGVYDVYPICPTNQPPESAACDSQGMICSYYTGCVDNCLCTSTGWVCAAQEPCVSNDF